MKPYGVTVHILEPGYFRTEITNVNNLLPRMEKAWNRMTTEEREEYGEEYYQECKWLSQDCGSYFEINN